MKIFGLNNGNVNKMPNNGQLASCGCMGGWLLTKEEVKCWYLTNDTWHPGVDSLGTETQVPGGHNTPCQFASPSACLPFATTVCQTALLTTTILIQWIQASLVPHRPLRRPSLWFLLHHILHILRQNYCVFISTNIQLAKEYFYLRLI